MMRRRRQLKDIDAASELSSVGTMVYLPENVMLLLRVVKVK